MKFLISLLAISVLLCTACVQEKNRAPSEEPASTQENSPARIKEVNREGNSDWTSEDELPLLRADLIAPQKDAKLFAVERSRLRYPKERKTPTAPMEKPFQTDKQAVAAAQDWIQEHFGQLPEGVSLKATEVHRSSSGRSNPEFDWDVGHTIFLRAYYHGIPAYNVSIVYITGKTLINATIDLRRYTPLETRKHIVDASTAKRAWRKIIAAREDSAETLKQFDANVKPTLSFAWSPAANNDVGIEYDVLAPTWVLDEAELFMVDGHSGKPWLND
jgi:hypothetical protein